MTIAQPNVKKCFNDYFLLLMPFPSVVKRMELQYLVRHNLSLYTFWGVYKKTIFKVSSMTQCSALTSE